ncbi:MAG: hypothetical protein GY949_19490, partial [Gammaproteobacteria bacterium]|nr:hypothetical protein [Gammaproteobacteria bacterium]
EIPVIERSSINTQALIREGQSLLIGGMVRDSATTTVDKVPGLGDVPVLGGLFRTKGRSNARVERMFLITPRIAGSQQRAPQPNPTRIQQASAPRTGAQVASARPVTPIATPAAVMALPARAVMPTRRASVVLDLNAPLPGSSRKQDYAPRITEQNTASSIATGG